jgi:DNA-binding transcriptional ArsR family regulator
VNPGARTSNVFQAIADPNRRRILELLREDEHSVQDLVSAFDVTFGAISQHLKILREAHLVTRRKEGRKRIYRLRAQPLKEVHDWTAVYEAAWRGRFHKLRKRVENDE